MANHSKIVLNSYLAAGAIEATGRYPDQTQFQRLVSWFQECDGLPSNNLMKVAFEHFYPRLTVSAETVNLSEKEMADTLIEKSKEIEHQQAQAQHRKERLEKLREKGKNQHTARLNQATLRGGQSGGGFGGIH